MNVFQNFAKDFTESQIEAANNFCTAISFFGSISTAEAEKVFSVYMKEKVIKFDHIARTYTVKHGAFLDNDVILNALDAANA